MNIGTTRHSDRVGPDREAAPEPALVAGFDLAAHLQRQRDWSERTFGPGPRTAGVIDHIRKELKEIEADPGDVTEWIDVVILALDGALRAGYQPHEIIAAMVAKQTKNEARVWPDWRSAPADKAIEHDRSHDTANATTEPSARPELCSACFGKGYLPGVYEQHTCSACNGSGRIPAGGSHG